jgi:hypothetical protein
MKIRLRSVTQVLVGLHRVGLMGLEKAIEEAERSGLEDRDELLDLMMGILKPLNYIPSASRGDYRQAVWREYRRHRGEDIRDLYSEIEVVVRGEPSEELDRFIESISRVLAEHELKPFLTIEEPDPAGPNPQLLIAGDIVVAGTTKEAALRRAIGAQISDW